MLVEAVRIIRELWTGEYVNFRGEHYDVESARIWDVPQPQPPIGIAVSGAQSCRLAAEHGDQLIAVEPDPKLVSEFAEAGGHRKPRVGQVAVSYDRDERAARKRALEQFRWFAGGWKVNAELPGPSAFAAASKYVREEDIAEQIPCGPDIERYVEAVRAYVDAGFTHVAIVQAGGEQQEEFLRWAEKDLLPALRT
jgi:G6PDH family F420-dependent oxidoreductase